MMKYLLQKTTVLILAVCMILSCIVLPVSAEETQYAEQEAAEEMAVASGVKYIMYAGSEVMNTHVLE